MTITFSTTLLKDAELNATGIQVPAEVIQALGSGKKPRVKVTVNDFTYRSTVAVFGGEYFIPLSAERRQAARVQAGDPIEVSLELDTEPRTVTIPPDLANSLEASGISAAFEALSYTLRKEYVRQVTEAKAPETRTRRIGNIVQKLSGS